MGLFDFNKKKSASVAQVQDATKKETPKEESKQTAMVDVNRPTIKINKLSNMIAIPEFKGVNYFTDIVGVDVSYDSTTKTFNYNTGLSFEIPEDHLLIIKASIDSQESKFGIVGGVVVVDSVKTDEVIIPFKQVSGKFAPQPFELGTIIAKFVVIPVSQYKIVWGDK